ncbi:unnamed protein product, partial [Durusdinium trenchii]
QRPCASWIWSHCPFWAQPPSLQALWFLPHRVSSICSCGCSSCLLCGSLSIRRPAPPILACNAKTSALYSWRWISGDRCLAQHRGPPNWKADVSPWQSITPSPPWSVDWSRSWRCTWPCSVGRPFRNLMELNMDAHTHRAHLTSPAASLLNQNGLQAQKTLEFSKKGRGINSRYEMKFKLEVVIYVSNRGRVKNLRYEGRSWIS